MRALPMLAAAALFSTGAQAQFVGAGDVDTIMSIARSFGDATLQSQTTGAPKITGSINGVTYQVFFLNCSGNNGSTNCEDLNFYAGYADNKQPLENMNAWNRDSRFTKAYVDSDLDAVVEMDVNLEDGITRGTLSAIFQRWSDELDRYSRYIGFK